MSAREIQSHTRSPRSVVLSPIPEPHHSDAKCIQTPEQGTREITFHFPSACNEFTPFPDFSVCWEGGRHAVMAASMLGNLTDAKN